MEDKNDRRRRRLLFERDALLAQLQGSIAAQSQDKPMNSEDWAPFSHERFVDVQIQTLEHEKLKLIGFALERLDSGEYGTCIDCERPIPPKRLEAIPWANRCIGCQDRFAESERSCSDRAAAA